MFALNPRSSWVKSRSLLSRLKTTPNEVMINLSNNSPCSGNYWADHVSLSSPSRGNAKHFMRLFVFRFKADEVEQIHAKHHEGHMFHAQDSWKARNGSDAFRAMSREPTLQRFSVIEVVSDIPTYEVKVAFLDEDGQQCWRKFFTAEISKIVNIILNAGVVSASVSVIELGRWKNIIVGERVSEIFRAEGNNNSVFFFCRTVAGVLLGDEFDMVNSLICDDVKSIWKEQ